MTAEFAAPCLPGLQDGDVITFYPSLARRVGINKALILQQIHFLLFITEKTRTAYNYVDGKWWVYNTYQEWHDDHFPWLSPGTIKRLFIELEEAKLVISRPSPYDANDQTKWYRLNYAYWPEWWSASAPPEDKKKTRHKKLRPPSQTVTTPVTNCATVYMESETTTETTIESAARNGAAMAPPVDQSQGSGENPSDTPPPAPSPPPKKPTAQQAMFEAICRAFGLDIPTLTKTKRRNIGRIASELHQAGAQPDHLPGFVGWCRAQRWPEFTENVLATRWDDYKKRLPAFKNGGGADLPPPDPHCPTCHGQGVVLPNVPPEHALYTTPVPCPTCRAPHPKEEAAAHG